MNKLNRRNAEKYREENEDVRDEVEEAEQEAELEVWIAALRHERCERAAVQTRAGRRFFVEEKLNRRDAEI